MRINVLYFAAAREAASTESEIVDLPAGANVAALLLDLLDSTELQPGTAARFFRCDACRHKIANQLLEVVTQLGVQLLLRRLASKPHRRVLPGGSQDHRHRLRQPVPVRRLGFELFVARFGQRLKLRFAPGLRLAPFGAKPAPFLKPVECGIE